MKVSKKRVLLIDGNSFCYRAFYAIKTLSTSKGKPTNAVYGFVTMLNKLISEQKPDYLAVVFDLKGPTFRHKRFADYKVSRKPMPDELSVQLPVIKEVLQAYRIAIFQQKGFEADDIIATLVNRLSQNELEILIVTGDKDILQVVDKNTKILNPHQNNLILDEDWVRNNFGVEPGKINEIMGLAGDPGDNIPGVPGIGRATAVELIKKFGTVDQVLANIDKITNKARAALIKRFAQQAQMSKELATLKFNVPPFGKRSASDLLKELKMLEADKERLLKLFKELEFKSLMQQVAPESKAKIDYRVVSGADEAEVWLKALSAEESIALHLVSTHKDPMLAKISGIVFAFEKGKTLFFSLEQVKLDTLKPILESEQIKKVGHDLKYAKLVLSNCAVDLQGIDFDTMLASYLLTPERLKYELSDLALEYLNYKLEDVSQSLNAVLKLSKILRSQLKEKGLWDLFQDIEVPLIEVLARMEKEGVSLDRDFLLHLSRDFEKKLNNLTKDIYEMAGEEFNINSPKQLSSILFEKLRLPKIKRTKTGTSTDTEVLRKLSAKHPIASALLEFREIAKLKSTYVDGLIKLLHHKTHKIHTSFNQAGTATGRLSSREPNLQNIPIRTDSGKKIRRAFIADKKTHLLLSADYSQIELRILAHLSGDKNLISAFKQDLDIHSYTASLIFAVDVHKVSSEMRDTAKTVNFGITYGMSAYGLSKDLGIGVQQAQEFIDAYFQRYAGVKGYISGQIKRAERSGYVTTLLRRRRYIPQIKSRDENIRRFAQRVAINAPVQGTAADLIKAAMVQIHRSSREKGLTGEMIIQVHDELVFSVPQQELADMRSLIKDKMENVIKLKVPVKVSIKTGSNWLEMK